MLGSGGFFGPWRLLVGRAATRISILVAAFFHYKNFKGGQDMWKMLIVGFLGVCLLTGASAAYAFDAKQLQKLKTTTSCAKCDLSGADLSGLDLSYADLSGANLSGANLTNGTFYSGNLAGANLAGANLSGANFYDANLNKADMKGAILTNANFYGATWVDGRKCKHGSTGLCK